MEDHLSFAFQVFADPSSRNTWLSSTIALIKTSIYAAIAFPILIAMPFFLLGWIGYRLKRRRWLGALKLGVILVGLGIMVALPYLASSDIIGPWLAFGFVIALLAYSQLIEW